MPLQDPKAEVATLLAPSVECVIAQGKNEEFPDGYEMQATRHNLDPKTLEVICRMNIPKGNLRYFDDEVEYTDYGVEQSVNLECYQDGWDGHIRYYLMVCVTQCRSYVDAIKAMRQSIGGTFNGYRPSKNNKLGNYALETKDGSALIWVRFTTVVKLRVEDESGSK